MKIYLIESDKNKELNAYLKTKYNLLDKRNLSFADVIIVSRVCNVKEGLAIVDFALMQGKEVICIKHRYAKESYLSNYLIQNGAKYI